MGKKINITLFILIMYSSLVYSAGLQVHLNNGMWQSVGFKGAYSTEVESVGYDADLSFEFYDIADGTITWVSVNNNDPDELIYNGITAGAITQTATYGVTTQLNATIGLFAILNQRSKKTSGFTILDGSTTNIVKMKVDNPLSYRSDVPMYRMYVEGKTGVATFRLDFQANYQGLAFKMRFGKEEESYNGYFDYANTYDNPATLKLDVAAAKATSKANIVDSIDFNITDNNITSFFTTTGFRVKDSSGSYTSNFRAYNADTGNRIEAYNMIDNSTWQRFDTANSLSSSNTFTKFTSGKGYWVRATSQEANTDNNHTKIGLLTSTDDRINEDEAYGKLTNGWHMLSFSESDLRYAPSGMFVPLGTAIADGLKLYFNRHGSTITSGDRGRDLNISSIITPNVAGIYPKMINIASKANSLLYGDATKIRAFPAIDLNNSGMGNTDGVIILSDHLIEVNSSNASITTLAGAPLRATPRGTYSSVYGEFMLAATLNDFTTEEINATIGISMPKYSSNEIVVSDLNTTDLDDSLALIKKGLEDAATKAGSSTPATRTNGYHINLDFNATFSASSAANFDHTFFPHILLTSGARFSLTDKTTTRLYEFQYNGRFKVSGPLGNREVTPSVLDDNITRTVDVINTQTASTGVRARALGNNYFMITSGNGAISLEEDYNATLFKDVPLGSGSIPDENLSYTKGALIEVYSHRDILDRELTYDLDFLDGPNDNDINWSQLYTARLVTDINGTPNSTLKAPNLTNDLRSNAIWALDFPIKQSLIQKFAKYGKKITNINIQRFSHDNIPYYDFLDLTKDPDDWYGNTYNTDTTLRFNEDHQGIFHIFPNTNYWVRIMDKANTKNVSSVLSNDSSISYTAKPSFNNKISEGVASTQNHINHTLNIKFMQSFINPVAKDYYNVVAIIGGTRYYLRDNGKYFTLNINDLDMNLASKTPTQANDSIFINAYDGEGNVYKEEGTTSSRFSVYFKKPPTPKVSWDSDGKLMVTNKANYMVERYTNYISDIASKRNDAKVSDTNNTKFSWKVSANKDTYGQAIALRVVLKDAKYDLYSDAKALLYAPLNEGHILKVTKANKISRIPYSYMQKQMLANRNPGSKTFDKYNGKNGLDNGIQLSMQEGANDKDVGLYYYPEGAESQLRLEQLSGARTMYISLENDSTTGKKAVVSITYIPSYESMIFYLSFNGNLYQGRFQANDNFNNDSSKYDLSIRSLDIDSVFNNAGTNQTQENDTQGFKLEMGATNVQPIDIPMAPRTPTPTTPTPTPNPNPPTTTPKPTPNTGKPPVLP